MRSNQPSVPLYQWRCAPTYLQTYSQLRAKHLKPRDRSEPDGCLRLHDEWLWLYDERQATPRRQCSERQLEALTQARRCLAKKYQCQHCHQQPENLAAVQYAFLRPGLCRACKEQLEWEAKQLRRAMRRRADRQEAEAWARQILARTDVAILDTETSSLSGYPIEIAVIALDGTVLFHQLVTPPVAVDPEAHAIHGISDEELATAPALPDVWADLQKALVGRTLLLAYNASFDQAVMERAARHYGLPVLEQEWECIMLWHAQYFGEWSTYHGGYKWQPLDGGHRALGDCQAALERLRDMAAMAPSEEEENLSPVDNADEKCNTEW